MDNISKFTELSKLPIDEQIKSYVDNMNKTTEYKGEDGFIYCSKCHTPRLAIIRYGNGKEVVSRIPCKCMLEKRKQREQQEQEDRQREIMKQRRVASLLVGEYECLKFDLTNLTGADKSFIEAYERLQKYAEIHSVARSNGYGIYLWGECGVGKTHLSACLANRLLEKGCNVLFTNMVEVSRKIRETFNNRYGDSKESKIINDLTNVDFLFLDDFGTEEYAVSGQDNWLQKTIYSILNSRVAEHKPTIFTSNYSIQDLHQKRGLSVKNTDRVIALSTAIMNIKGISYRLKRRNTDLPF